MDESVREMMLVAGAVLVASVIFILATQFAPLADRAPGYVGKNIAMTVDSVTSAPEDSSATYIFPENSRTLSLWSSKRVISTVVFDTGGNRIEVSRFDVCHEALLGIWNTGEDIVNGVSNFIMGEDVVDSHSDALAEQTQNSYYHRMDKSVTDDMDFEPNYCTAGFTCDSVKAYVKQAPQEASFWSSDTEEDHVYAKPDAITVNKTYSYDEDNQMPKKNQIHVIVQKWDSGNLVGCDDA
jgi:hypothetical protein